MQNRFTCKSALLAHNERIPVIGRKFHESDAIANIPQSICVIAPSDDDLYTVTVPPRVQQQCSEVCNSMLHTHCHSDSNALFCFLFVFLQHGPKGGARNRGGGGGGLKKKIQHPKSALFLSEKCQFSTWKVPF